MIGRPHFVASVLMMVASFASCTRAVPQHTLIVVYERSFDEKKPYRLYLRGATLKELDFEKESLVHQIDSPNRCEVYGTGAIYWRAVTIQIDHGSVRLNGKQLPNADFNGFVVGEDGTFTNGYISSSK